VIPRPTPPAPHWGAPLLVTAAPGGRTLVAAGRIEGGRIVFKLPTLG
jgi:hypothetical protein